MSFDTEYVQTNTFSPLGVTRSPAGTSTSSALSIDVNQEVGQNYSTNTLRRSYQTLDAADYPRANPPFNYGSAGRIPKSFSENSAVDPRILRGYIRRAAPQASDPTSNYRLYFMYNPATIQRQFVSYLEQAALDPFNTILNSGNLVAPPGILDFSFELFFDRQVENANGDMPRGVLEDYDYFDLVVRGVVPDPQSPVLPDNGVLMTNPRNITVVFSPQLSVTGRPDQASVVYEKFDHRMRPIRMRIVMSMKAYSIGPTSQNFAFASSSSESKAQATIPYSKGTATVQLLTNDYINNIAWVDATLASAITPYTGGTGTSGGGGAGGTISATGQGLIAAARTFLGEQYSTGAGRTSTTSGYKDCSGLIVAAYKLATGKDLGASTSSSIYKLCADQGLGISFDRAKAIAGACLLMPEDPMLGVGSAGHIGFSDGNGGTVEATPPKVQALSLNDQSWGSHACLLPGIQY